MQRECSRTLMILAETLVLTDFGVCLLVEHVRVILFESQRSYGGGMLDYCTRLKCWDRVRLGQLLLACCLLACLHLKVYVGMFHGIGNGVTTAGWVTELLDGLLIILATNHVFQVVFGLCLDHAQV